MFWSFVSITQFSNFLVMSEQNWKLLFGIFELWKLSYNGILVNTRIFGTHNQREVMSLLFFFFFSSLFFLSFLLHRLTQELLFLFSFFLLLSFSFFLSSSQTHSNGHFFLLLHSFSFFSSSQKHMGNFIKKKKNTWVPISQTHKHMILIIHTVFSHSPSGFFFSIWLSQIQVISSTGCLVGGLRSEMGLVWWCCWETKPRWRKT